MVPRLILAGALAAALVPVGAAYAAPAMDALQPCYVAAQPGQTEAVAVKAHGFTPNALIDVYVDNVPQAPTDPPAQADVNGDVSGSVPAPYIALGVRPFTLRLVQHTGVATPPPPAVERVSKVAALSVEQVPAKAATGARVRFRGRGFTARRAVWAHYVYAGTSHKTVRIGRPFGQCGSFSRKMRQFPFRYTPKVGSWTIQFDQQKKFDPKADVLVRLTIKVNRTIKPR